MKEKSSQPAPCSSSIKAVIKQLALLALISGLFLGYLLASLWQLLLQAGLSSPAPDVNADPPDGLFLAAVWPLVSFCKQKPACWETNFHGELLWDVQNLTSLEKLKGNKIENRQKEQFEFPFQNVLVQFLPVSYKNVIRMVYNFEGWNRISWKSNTLIYLKLSNFGIAGPDKFITCFAVENKFQNFRFGHKTKKCLPPGSVLNKIFGSLQNPSAVFMTRMVPFAPRLRLLCFHVGFLSCVCRRAMC